MSTPRLRALPAALLATGLLYGFRALGSVWALGRIARSYVCPARSKKRERGFTLVELLIVVAIIGILAALLIAGVKAFLAS